MRLTAQDVFAPGSSYAAHMVAHQPSWSYPQHEHQGFCEIIAVLGGRLHHRTAAGLHVLEAGSVTLVREQDWHALDGDGVIFVNVNVPRRTWAAVEALFGGLPELAAAAAPPSVRLEGPDLVRLTMDLQQVVHRQADPQAFRVLAPWLAALVPRLLADPVPARRAALPAWLSELLDEAEARLEAGIDVPTLVRHAGVSPAHCARTFRRHLQTTPTAWLEERRLERAGILLARTDRPLLDIALGLGFGSLSYFHRQFRKRFATTPMAWRQAQVRAV